MRALLAFLLILFSTPAAMADYRASWNDDLYGPKGLTIDVKGSMARLSAPANDSRYGIYRDGILYLALKQADGSYATVKADDMISAVDAARGTKFKPWMAQSIAKTLKGVKLNVRKLGNENMFGFAGTTWEIRGLDGPNPDFPYKVVASNAPELKTMAEAYRRFLEVSLATSFELIGEKATREMITEVRAKNAHGYPLMMGGQARITSFQRMAFDAGHFALPGQTVPLAVVIQSLKAQAPFERSATMVPSR